MFEDVKAFTPLPKFMHPVSVKKNTYRNTCFIASVMQLRDFTPELEETLKLTESGWSDVVSYVGSEAFVHGECNLDAGYDGQHHAGCLGAASFFQY